MLHLFRLLFQYEVSSDLRKSQISIAIKSVKKIALPIYTSKHCAVFPLNVANLVY